MRRSRRRLKERDPVLARIAGIRRSAQLRTLGRGLAGLLEDGADRVSHRYRDAVNAYYKKLSEEQ